MNDIANKVRVEHNWLLLFVKCRFPTVKQRVGHDKTPERSFRLPGKVSRTVEWKVLNCVPRGGA